MSDLPPEQQESYLRARELTRPAGIERTLDRLDLAAQDRGVYDLRQLCGDAATTIRHLLDQRELEAALARLGRDAEAQAEADDEADQ